MNVVFISIDDLNDWANVFTAYPGAVHTPNIDRLIDSGVSFENAYSQAAVCNVSRTSVLSGQDPTTTQVLDNSTDWQDKLAPSMTLPAFMKDAGYYSAGAGKLFHKTFIEKSIRDQLFDEYQAATGARSFPDDEAGHTTVGDFQGGVFDPSGGRFLDDAATAAFAENFLSSAQADAGPFMLSLGFIRPHLDWVVPQEYFDLYPLEEIVLPGKIDPVTGLFVAPDGTPDIDSSQKFFELLDDNKKGTHGEIVTEDAWKLLVQAYLASISYMDHQLGRVLDAIDANGHTNDTMIVAWSDHGYHLGDREQLWGKFTLWEEAAKAPLVIKVPGVTDKSTNPADHYTLKPVELLDIYPTILELAGIAPSQWPPHLEGQSLAPLVNGTGTINKPAFTWMYGSYSVRDGNFRYTRYEDGSEELYDLAQDPSQLVNLAGDAAFAAIKAGLIAEVNARYSIVHATTDGAVVNGTAGDDIFVQFEAAATLNGGAGNDVYFVNGDLRDETVPAGQIEVVINEMAGQGRDVIFSGYDFTLPDHVEDAIVRPAPFAGGSHISGNALDNVINANKRHDQLLGRQGNDTLTGGVGNDGLFGQAGHDSLIGDADNDKLNGGFGNDTLDGGSGLDFALFGGVVAISVNLNISGAQNTGQGTDILKRIENLSGGTNNDKFIGNAAANVLHGLGGADTLDGRNGDDSLLGGGGNDRLLGRGGKDTLLGTTGNDFLAGGSGSDRLNGGKGVDTLQGDQGNDTLIGGGYGDVFVFAKGFGRDTALDYQLGIDQLQLNDALWGGGLTAKQVVNMFGITTPKGVVLDFGSDELTLKTLASLSSLHSDIVIV